MEINELLKQHGDICEQLKEIFNFTYPEIKNQDDALQAHLRNNDSRNLVSHLVQKQWQIEFQILLRMGFNEQYLLPRLTTKTFSIEELGNIYNSNVTTEGFNITPGFQNKVEEEDVKWVD